MEYKVVLIESDEGFSVNCPLLEGCCSQGQNRQEALDNIRIAIREWLEVEGSDQSVFKVSEEVVSV